MNVRLHAAARNARAPPPPTHPPLSTLATVTKNCTRGKTIHKSFNDTTTTTAASAEAAAAAVRPLASACHRSHGPRPHAAWIRGQQEGAR